MTDATKNTPETSEPSKSINAIIIDFDAAVRSQVTLTLRRMGINIVQSVTTKEQLKNHVDSIDCPVAIMIVNSQLPNYGAINAVTSFRSFSRFREVPALFITPTAVNSDLARYMLGRKIVFVPQPWDVQNLAGGFKKIMQYCVNSKPARRLTKIISNGTILELIDQDVLSVPSMTHLHIATEVLYQSQRQYLLVLDGHEVMGTYTKEDVANLMYVNADMEKLTLADLAHPKPPKMRAGISPESALLQLEGDSFDIIDVVDLSDESLGIVTKHNLVNNLIGLHYIK